MKDIKRTFGQRIKTLRRFKSLTQEQLAERSGLSYKFIGEIERGTGNPTIDTIGKIARALEVPVARLLTEKKEEEEWIYLLRKEDLLTLRKAAEILEGIFGKKPISR
ncbi:MAG: helix-turn-helix domain-containing protein [Proteobacteria bacterium]|nr:helix-turn-helix domain-containing protein [Pseudomonadota bacterium]